jgi:hypothetical protein
MRCTARPPGPRLPRALETLGRLSGPGNTWSGCTTATATRSRCASSNRALGDRPRSRAVRQVFTGDPRLLRHVRMWRWPADAAPFAEAGVSADRRPLLLWTKPRRLPAASRAPPRTRIRRNAALPSCPPGRLARASPSSTGGGTRTSRRTYGAPCPTPGAPSGAALRRQRAISQASVRSNSADTRTPRSSPETRAVPRPP